jgi:transcriptional regulator of heat shock response
MNNEDLAFEIAKRFLEIEAEISAFREVLRRYWKYPESPWESLVDKGKEQILAREAAQNYPQLQSVFAAASDDAHLIQTLHDQLLRRVTVE